MDENLGEMMAKIEVLCMHETCIRSIVLAAGNWGRSRGLFLLPCSADQTTQTKVSVLRVAAKANLPSLQSLASSEVV